MGRDIFDDEQEIGKFDVKICICNDGKKALENMGILE